MTMVPNTNTTCSMPSAAQAADANDASPIPTATPAATSAPAEEATMKGTRPAAQQHPPSRLAPFNPSSQQVQDKSMEMLQLTSQDVLFDLGCGDGRLLLHAAQQVDGLRCVGIEMDPIYATRGKEAVALLPADIQARVDIRQGDVLEDIQSSVSQDANGGRSKLSLSKDATALYLFILPQGVVKLMPLLNALVKKRRQENRSIRILSYMFQIREWEPTLVDSTSRGNLPLYLYQFDP